MVTMRRHWQKGVLYKDMDRLRVRYIGGWDTLALKEGKVYDVMSVEKGWYRIMSELDEDYLFPPKLFEVVSNGS